jgi:hypothetical protein
LTEVNKTDDMQKRVQKHHCTQEEHQVIEAGVWKSFGAGGSFFSLDRHGALQVDAVMLVEIGLSVGDSQNEGAQEGRVSK